MIRIMAKDSLLGEGEEVVFTAHSHWKNLVVPMLVTVLTVAGVAVIFVMVFKDSTDYDWARWTVLAIAGIVLLVFAGWPFISWLASTETLTTRRLISRDGVFSREGRDIPIDRVHSVSYRRSFLDRILGSGTLVVRTAADQSDVELHDVAHLERRILQLQELILDEEIPGADPDDAGHHGDAPGRSGDNSV